MVLLQGAPGVLRDHSTQVLLGLWVFPSWSYGGVISMCTDVVSDPLGLLLAVLTLLEAFLCLRIW